MLVACQSKTARPRLVGDVAGVRTQNPPLDNSAFGSGNVDYPAYYTAARLLTTKPARIEGMSCASKTPGLRADALVDHLGPHGVIIGATGGSLAQVHHDFPENTILPLPATVPSPIPPAGSYQLVIRLAASKKGLYELQSCGLRIQGAKNLLYIVNRASLNVDNKLVPPAD